MQYSAPVQVLVDEHEVILGVLEAVEAVNARSATQFPQEFYEQALDFFATFADRCHHGKEEDVFFPTLEARGIPRGLGPIACMLQEHDIGRAHVVAAREALRLTADGNTAAQAIVRRQTGEFVTLLRDHIAKENQILFVMGDRLLTDDDRAVLLDRFDQADATGLPAGTTDRCVSLARELRREAGLGDGPPQPVTVSGHACRH